MTVWNVSFELNDDAGNPIPPPGDLTVTFRAVDSPSIFNNVSNIGTVCRRLNPK